MTKPVHNKIYGEPELAKIAELWMTNLSTAKIGERVRLSKNNVCRLARAARLRGDPRFPERGSPIKGFKRRPAPQITRVSAPVSARPVAIIATLAPRLWELGPLQCKYPTTSGLPGDHRFCGKPQHPGSPYCYEHNTLCNVPARGTAR